MAFNTLISSGCSISLYVFVFKKTPLYQNLKLDALHSLKL